MMMNWHSFWRGFGVGCMFASILIMITVNVAHAAELPFKTREWTDGHGRVCTATIDGEWENFTRCDGPMDAPNCHTEEILVITRATTLDCDWPRERWDNTSYTVECWTDSIPPQRCDVEPVNMGAWERKALSDTVNTELIDDSIPPDQVRDGTQ